MNDINFKHIQYDSIAEKEFHIRHPHLFYNTNNKLFNCSFTDINNSSFHAAWDFYDEATNTYIELKSHQLNYHDSKNKADHCFADSAFFSTSLKHRQLKHGWNHSLIKHAIVANKLNDDENIIYVVIFINGTNLSTQFRNRAHKANLIWFMEKDYFS